MLPSGHEINRALARLKFNFRRRQRLYRQLTGLMRSGMSRSEAVGTICKIVSRDGRRQSDTAFVVLSDVAASLQNGFGLARALERWVPREDFMVIGTIEDSDLFPEHLEAYCKTLDDRADMRSKAVGALAYPGFLSILAFGLLIYFDMKIGPALAALLAPEEWTGFGLLLRVASSWCADYVIPLAAATLALPTCVILLLPRWHGLGRDLADRMPVFSLYRSYSGVAFVQAMGVLMSGGLTASEAVFRIRSGANPYVARQLDRVRTGLLDGQDLGSSMEGAAGWPDPELSLSIRILSRTPDFPARLLEIARLWRLETNERTERGFLVLRSIAFLLVFVSISGVVFAMYDIQGQVAAAVR